MTWHFLVQVNAQENDRTGELEPTQAALDGLDPIYDLLEQLRRAGHCRDYWLGEVVDVGRACYAVFTVEVSR